nr:MAG TPA: Glucose-regulated metallo-peptidase M90 [Caudoviricetes sp.]
MILHEIIHALTVNALNNPKTKEERVFAKSINKLTNKAKKLFNKYRQLDSDDVAYALSNEKEFAAMFITDDSIRTEILGLLNKDNSLLSTIKHFVNSLTKFLVNKNVFNTTEEKIKAAQKKFLHFLDS